MALLDDQRLPGHGAAEVVAQGEYPVHLLHRVRAVDVGQTVAASKT